MRSTYFLLSLPALLISVTCFAQEKHYVTMNNQVTLTQSGASAFARLPLRCAEKELPYKTGIVYNDTSLITAPKNYHPAFFGCFDWHSSVHGHWMLARLLKNFPGLPEEKQIRDLFNEHFSVANIQQELVLFKSKDNKTFERTYGWAWLLQLQDELNSWDDKESKKWAATLQPLTDQLSNLTIDYLDKIVYPIRVGEHTNLAFGLSLMIDYAIHHNDTALSNTIKKAALRFYMNDKNCPFGWEPGGNDFLSPCLEEANLMRKILPKRQYLPWLKNFMPLLFDENFEMEPGQVKDRTDGKLVHLDGLNLSRAWCFKGIAQSTGNQHLLQLANQHLDAALPQVASGDYAGEHWLASFAVYALSNN